MNQPSDWINLAGVLVSVFSAGFAVLSSRRASAAEEKAQKYQARAETQSRLARQAAEAAAVAQRESAEAASRAATALEKQIQMAEEQAELAEGVPWDVQHRKGSLWELWNVTDSPKFRVEISGPGVSSSHKPPVVDRMDGRSSVEFRGTTGYGASRRVEVRWHRREDAQGEPLVWAGTMPEEQ